MLMNDEIFQGRHINGMKSVKHGIFKSYKRKNGIYKKIFGSKLVKSSYIQVVKNTIQNIQKISKNVYYSAKRKKKKRKNKNYSKHVPASTNYYNV